MKRTLLLLSAFVVLFCLSSCFLRPKPTLESYVEKNQALFELIGETSDEDGIDMEFSARGDDLVVTVRIKEAVAEDCLADIKESMSAATVKQKDVYVAMLEEIRSEVDTANSIIIEFYDINGVLLVCEQFN